MDLKRWIKKRENEEVKIVERIDRENGESATDTVKAR